MNHEVQPMKRLAQGMKRTKPREPSTRLEWQEAVNAAEFGLLVSSARAYGLITAGPEFDLDRCERILADGKAQGVVPCQQYCRVCGCTYDDPCEEGCYWVEPDLCSQCAQKSGRKRKGANHGSR